MLLGYHWDCSDWVRRSQNPLPNITEVPGSEVPDSSSFHSNESNESNTHQLPTSKYRSACPSILFLLYQHDLHNIDVFTNFNNTNIAQAHWILCKFDNKLTHILDYCNKFNSFVTIAKPIERERERFQNLYI